MIDEDLIRRAKMPDGYIECECGVWVRHEHAFLCDDGPILCSKCALKPQEIAAQKRNIK